MAKHHMHRFSRKNLATGDVNIPPKMALTVNCTLPITIEWKCLHFVDDYDQVITKELLVNVRTLNID